MLVFCSCGSDVNCQFRSDEHVRTQERFVIIFFSENSTSTRQTVSSKISVPPSSGLGALDDSYFQVTSNMLLNKLFFIISKSDFLLFGLEQGIWARLGFYWIQGV